MAASRFEPVTWKPMVEAYVQRCTYCAGMCCWNDGDESFQYANSVFSSLLFWLFLKVYIHLKRRRLSTPTHLFKEYHDMWSIQSSPIRLTFLQYPHRHRRLISNIVVQIVSKQRDPSRIDILYMPIVCCQGLSIENPTWTNRHHYISTGDWFSCQNDNCDSHRVSLTSNM